MRAVQKMALSLLISVVAFSLFALFAYSGFFSFIQSNFYDLRVRQQIMKRLDTVGSAAATYERRYFDRFSPFIAAKSVKSINNVNQSAQDIFDRKDLFQKLQTEYPGILSVRFIDRQGNIHFSTLQSDILRATNYETVYKTLAMADPHDPFARQEESTAKGQEVYIDGSAHRLLFRLPWTDLLGNIVGSAVFSVTVGDLQSYLVRHGVLGPDRHFDAVGNAGFVIGIDHVNNEKLAQEVLQGWRSSHATSQTGLPIAVDNAGGQLFLFSVKTTALGFFGEVVPQSEFALDKMLQLLLSVSLFLTVFLLAFLILSLRQDKLLVLADRIKRFQINFLKEYLESKSTLDWARWHSELEHRRSEVRREIKKGIGRLGNEREATVDGLIDKSWDEILTVIGKRVDDDSVSAREVRGLEEAIRKLLASGELAGGVSRGIPAPARAPTRTAALQAAPATPERGGAEAVEEPGEVAAVEEVPEAEAVEELEEVAAAEEVPEAEEEAAVEAPGEVAAAEEVPEAEAVEELEEVAAAEEVPEAEAAAAVEAPGEVAAAEEVPEAEAVEELEEVAAVEEAPEAEAAAAVEAPGEVAAAEEVPEAEAVEELEELPEVVSETTGEGAASAGLGGGGATGQTSSADILAPDFANADDLENAEVLDLEAIFHGDELLADIDIFEEMESKAGNLGARAGIDEGASKGVRPAARSAVGTNRQAAAERQPGGPDQKRDEELEEFFAELEEVEPLEATHPEIARIDEQEDEEELEQIEMLEPADVEGEPELSGDDMVGEEASLETASYGLALFKEFQGKRTPVFAEQSQADSFGELVEIDESESEVNENDHGDQGTSVDEKRAETARRSPQGQQKSTPVGKGVPTQVEGSTEPGGAGPRGELESLESVEEAPSASESQVEEAEPLEELEEAESAEEVESVQELETVEEAVSGDSVEVPVVSSSASWTARSAVLEAALSQPRKLTDAEAEFEKRIQELVASKQIEIYSLSDVKSMGLIPDEAIEVADGVYKIKEEIVGRTGGGKDSELRDLVDSVVSSGTEEEEVSAIGQLLAIPTVELSFDDAGGESKEGDSKEREVGRRRPRPRDRKRGIRIMLTENGFDYDSFRSEFKSNYMGIMKSLMRISQKVDAIYAAILVPKEGGLMTEYSIGLGDASTYSLKFDRSDPVLRHLLAQRDLVYLKVPKTGLPELDSRIAPRDLRFMTGTIYLPIIFASHQGYLFFGLKNNDLSIQDYMLKILEE